MDLGLNGEKPSSPVAAAASAAALLNTSLLKGLVLPPVPIEQMGSQAATEALKVKGVTGHCQVNRPQPDSPPLYCHPGYADKRGGDNLSRVEKRLLCWQKGR